MIAYGVLITMKVSDLCYDLGIKGQLYLKSVLFFLFLMEGIHIWHNYCLWCVGLDHGYDLEVKGQGQIYSKSVLQLVIDTMLVYSILITTKVSDHHYNLCVNV